MSGCKDLALAGLQVIEHKSKPDRAELPSFRSEIEMLRSHFYFLLGKVEHTGKNFHGALDQYEKCLKHDSTNFEAHFCMAQVQYSLGNFQAAE